jgi:hypothetical protein
MMRTLPSRWTKGRRLLALLGVMVLGAMALGATTASASSNIGGGPIAGTVSFNPGAYIPPPGAPCAPTSFSLNGVSTEAFVLNTVGTEYIGPVTITGNGGSTCEGASTGGGNLTLTYVQGFGPTEGRLDCANPTAGTTISGTYLRIGTAVTATLHGSCKVNDFPANVNFIFHGQFIPTNSGGGVTAPISAATFAGPFTVTPTS